MAQRFTDYQIARTEAQRMANGARIDVAIRFVREYGKDGYNVGYASRNDSDYARAEIVRPTATEVDR